MSDRELPLWDKLDVEPSHEPPDLARVIELAAETETMSWRLFTDLASQIPRSDAWRPLFVLNFIRELSAALSPETILDPFVRVPAALSASIDGAGNAEALGLVPSPTVRAAAAHLSGVEWRLGDPLLALLPALQTEGSRYDLIIIVPPHAARFEGHLGKNEPAYLRNEIADLLILRSLPLLAETGHALVEVTDGFFLMENRRRLRLRLAASGFHLLAIASVEHGTGIASTVPTSLTLFGRQPRERIFVGRLRKDTPVSALVGDAVAHADRVPPEPGASIPPEEFRGWHQFSAQRELEADPGMVDARPLDDIAEIRQISLRPDTQYDPPPNAVYVPTLGFGPVTTTPPDLTRVKSKYYVLEVRVDPALASADYVAEWLSSTSGRRAREAVGAGGIFPRIAPSAIHALRVPVPSPADQRKASGVARHLISMEAEISRLRARLWQEPAAAEQLLDSLEQAAKADPLRRWVDLLPYPLASVLYSFLAEQDTERRVNRLLHFFEVTAEFSCTVLLSVLWRDEGLRSSSLPHIAGAAPPGRRLLTRTDFGLWINLGRTLAKSIQRSANDEQLRTALDEAVGPVRQLVFDLTDKHLWRLLDEARLIRNQRAHGGVANPSQLDAWLSQLQALVSRIERILGSSFQDIALVRGNAGRYHAGVHTYSRAERLVGPNNIFQEREVRTLEPLESDHVAFVRVAQAPGPTLQLLPFLRLGASESASKNACYFFNSEHSSHEYDYVSYHFEDEPSIRVTDDAMRQIISDLEK